MRIEEAWGQLHHASDLAAARGSLLFHLDLATTLACAAFDLCGVVPDRVVTLVDETGYRTIAVGAAPARRALSEASFDSHGDVQVVPASGRMPPRMAALSDAMATIAAAGLDGAARHAVIVVPADYASAAIEGYAVAVGEHPDAVQCAGHWRITLDPLGRRITNRERLVVAGRDAPVSVRALRDSVLTIPGAVPGEIHTYLSLKHGVPLIVETPESGARWRVDGERTDVHKRVIA